MPLIFPVQLESIFPIHSINIDKSENPGMDDTDGKYRYTVLLDNCESCIGLPPPSDGPNLDTDVIKENTILGLMGRMEHHHIEEDRGRDNRT